MHTLTRDLHSHLSNSISGNFTGAPYYAIMSAMLTVALDSVFEVLECHDLEIYNQIVEIFEEKLHV